MKIPAFLKVWLFTLLGLFSLTSLSSQCEASYIFGFVDDNTVLFYNNSENYNGQKWEFEDGISLENDSPLITYTFESDTNRVCLRVWTNDGCEDVQCFDVYPGAPDEMCQVSDCVWPGDANNDGQANNRDVLCLGLGYEHAGPQRQFFPDPANPIAWAANFSDDWSSNTNSINDKHLDCDGNGVIDALDMDAISENYQTATDLNIEPTSGAPLVQFEFQQDTIFYYNFSDLESIEINANLNLGTAIVPFEDLYGIALSISFPEELTLQNTTSFQSVSSFFGSGNNILTFGEDVQEENGRFDLAISRKSGPVSGSGIVGDISFIISADIIGGIADPHIPFEIEIEDLTAIDENGNEMAFDLPVENAKMVIIRDIVASEKSNRLQQQIAVFPNPVSEELWIDLGKLKGEQLVLYNILGQQRIVRRLNENKLRLAVDHLPPGIYLLSIHTEEGTLTKQIHVE